MRLLLPSLAAALLPLCAGMAARDRLPQVLSHRGACGYVPEHSLNAYQLAIDLGTDYIEPDLVVTKDGVFVAMHDLLLDDTTDVATHPEFADRKSTKKVNGVNTTGYFVIDFTDAELQTLTVSQRVDGRTKLFDGYFKIPRLTEVMTLAQSHYASTNWTIGLYIELKHPAFHKEYGFNTPDMLLTALSAGGYAINGDEVSNDLSQVVPVLVECFERDTLVYLKSQSTIPLVYLMKVASMEIEWNSNGLADIAAFANGIGPEKTFFEGPTDQAVAKVDLAHSFNLKLHPWTFRADSGIGEQFFNNFYAEEEYYVCCLKMDGLFTEFPDKTKAIIDNYLSYENSALCSTPCNITKL